MKIAMRKAFGSGWSCVALVEPWCGGKIKARFS